MQKILCSGSVGHLGFFSNEQQIISNEYINLWSFFQAYIVYTFCDQFQVQNQTTNWIQWVSAGDSNPRLQHNIMFCWKLLCASYINVSRGESASNFTCALTLWKATLFARWYMYFGFCRTKLVYMHAYSFDPSMNETGFSLGTHVNIALVATLDIRLSCTHVDT